MSGLLVAGILHQVPDLVVIGPHELEWAHLGIGDYRMRRGRPHMVIGHTTKGDDPQRIVEGAGPRGRAERTARMWGDDPTYSGAHIVIGSDGVVACLADLELVEAYHATVSNPYAIGIEIYQEPGGVIYRAALNAWVKVCNAIARICSIPRQMPSAPYHGLPLARMAAGGADCYGFFGHRDNTTRRGRGDPGDAAMQALAADGFEGFDIAARADLATWARRQRKLIAMGAKLTADGLCGPSTLAAMARFGFANGRELDAAVEATSPVTS